MQKNRPESGGTAKLVGVQMNCEIFAPSDASMLMYRMRSPVSGWFTMNSNVFGCSGYVTKRTRQCPPTDDLCLSAARFA